MDGNASFVAVLVRTGNTFKEKKATTDEGFGVSTLQQAQIYCLICLEKGKKEVGNERGHATTKLVREENFIASVTATVEVDERIKDHQLRAAKGVSNDSIFKVLHEDLGLSKKSSQLVPKLPSQAQKEERVRQFVAAVHRCSMAYLETIVTMDKSICLRPKGS